MASTKKALEEEFTKAPQAQTEEDVNNQDTRTRLWQSLNTTYGNQMEESDKAYDKSISQMNNSMLARGMQRSSYALAEAANMYNDKNTARNKLGQALIADYQNRLSQLDEAEAARKFQADEAEKGRQWQSNENALSRAFQTNEREATQKYNTGEREASQVYNTGERVATQAYNTAERIAQQIYNTGEREATQKYNTGEREATQKYNTGEREATQTWQAGQTAKEQAWQAGQTAQQQAWQAGQNALDRAQNQSQFESNQAFAREQWQAQQEQWKQEFDYNKMSNEQKLNYETVMYALQNGKDVSDDMLSKAGISRDDFNSMKAQAQASGVVSRNPVKEETPPKNMSTEDAFNAIMNAGGNNKTHAKLVTENRHEKSHAKLVTTSNKK